MDHQPPSAAWLESKSGEQTVVRGTCVLGRAVGCTLVLPGERVSRRHAMVHAQGDDEFWLVDLGSANGTYLNGRRVSQPCRLTDRDQVLVGDYSFTFRQPQAQRLAAESPAGTEKTIQEIKTLNCWLLVADIESSTQFTRRLPADEAPRVTGRWLADCKQIIDGHNGTINKFLGDGFLAYWPDREGAASSVAKTLTVLHQQQEKEHPRFRVVLHYGKVFMGGAASLGEESLLGSEVNFVFRMEKLAGSLGALRLMSDPAKAQLKSLCNAGEESRHPLPGFDGEFLFFRF